MSGTFWGINRDWLLREEREKLNTAMENAAMELVEFAPKTRYEARRYVYFMHKTTPVLRMYGLSEADFAWIVNQCGLIN